MTIDWPDDLRGREFLLMVERAKYERWLANEVAAILERAFNEVVDTILSPSFRTLSQAEQARKLQLFRELDRQITNGYMDVRNKLISQGNAYAEIERQVAGVQIRSMLVGSSDQLQASVGFTLSRHRLDSIARLPIQGLNISEWFDAQAAGMSRETRRTIQNGLVQGKSIPEMVKAIVPPRGSVEPAVYRRARHDAIAITRTTVNAVQSHSARETYLAAGSEVTDSYRFVAVRDARTSATCRALDGKVFRNDNDTAPRPPMHINCRSTTVPLVRAEFLSRKEQMTPLTFGSYGEWLREQSTSQQDAILGPTRATWWRSGRMTLADAVDSDNRVLTLAQLRNRLPIEELAGV